MTVLFSGWVEVARYGSRFIDSSEGGMHQLISHGCFPTQGLPEKSPDNAYGNAEQEEGECVLPHDGYSSVGSYFDAEGSPLYSIFVWRSLWPLLSWLMAFITRAHSSSGAEMRMNLGLALGITSKSSRKR